MFRKCYTSVITVIAAVVMALSAQAGNELYGQRASLFELLPVDSTKIVFLGNSLTHGCEWHELLNNPNAINRGIVGDVIEGVQNRLQPILDGHPAKIFLMIGANDVSHDLTADSIATATVALVKRIREASPQTELYFQSMLPINNSFGRYKLMIDKEQTIRDINALVRPQIEELGATWIELHSLMTDEDGNLRKEYTNDGLHLVGEAYLIWRDAVLPYVNN
ncbi:MAG: sialate O-acetylesterase [Muribaculaceae bacterium]|nr:sialate O-acetylesterase [Muribaculaceae bacterium]